MIIDSTYVLDACNAKKRSGAIKNLWFGNRAEIASYTPVDAGAELTAITMEASEVFYKIDFVKDSASFEETYEVGDSGSFLAVQALAFNIGRRSQESADFINMVKDSCRTVAIVEDYNGKMFILGREDGLELSEGSGTNPAERATPSDVVITMTANEDNPADTYSGSIPA